jgi:hypothetical protein
MVAGSSADLSMIDGRISKVIDLAFFFVQTESAAACSKLCRDCTLDKSLGREEGSKRDESQSVISRLTLGAIDVLPALVAHDIIDLLPREWCPCSHLLLNWKDKRACRAGPIVTTCVVISDQEHVGACRTEECHVCPSPPANRWMLQQQR